MLAELVRDRETVAIAGTSGKTTVTGMMGWLLEQLGADPTVVNGGALVNWADAERIGNVRIGRSNLCVIETDESDKSLLKFTPDWAIITNMSADHFDLDETRRLFAAFRSKVRRQTVAGWDPGMPWQGVKPELSRSGSRFTCDGVDFELPMLGAHNVENALQAAVLCQRMGYDLSRVAAALRTFRGVQRRLEKIGEARGVTVIDEYAHNPAKIAAAWRAVAPYYRRVIGFWRPHGFKPLSLMYQDLLATFRELCRPEDRLLLMPVYYAGGTVTRQVDSDALARDLRGQGTPVDWVETYETLLDRVLREAGAGDVVLCMGARDPGISQFASDVVSGLAG
jgi:UDP-N-acetylmuramate--alanine ligase